MTKMATSEKRAWLHSEKLVTVFFVSWVFGAFVWHSKNYGVVPQENRVISPYPDVVKPWDDTDVKQRTETVARETRKVWISTSVCFSGNTKFYKKSHYPYLFSTKLSSDLWHRVTNASTIVQVIYDEKDTGNAKMAKFKQELEENGSRVELVSSNGVSFYGFQL